MQSVSGPSRDKPALASVSSGEFWPQAALREVSPAPAVLRDVSVVAVEPPMSQRPLLPVPKPVTHPRQVLGRNTKIPAVARDDAYQLDVDGTTVYGAHARFDIPMLSADDAVGLRRLNATGDLRDVVFPDATEVAQGSARITLLLHGRDVVAIGDNVTYGPETVFVRRGHISVPTAGGGSAIVNSGGVLVQGNVAIGLAPHSDVTIDGMRITSPDSEVRFAYSAPDRYTIGTGATITQTPDRRVRLVGQGVSLRTAAATFDISGSVLVSKNGQTINPESGTVRHVVYLPAPPPAQAQQAQLADGRIALMRVPNGQLFINGVSDHDFDQGQTGDCWFVATVLAIAAMHPEMIQGMITNNNDNTYTVRLFKDGRAVKVTVDDEFYQRTERFYKPPSMVYGSSRNPREVWGPILEKADASLYTEGYQGIYGGFPHTAFRELTGLQSDEIKNTDVSADELFRKIADNVRARIPMVAVSGQPYKDPADEERRDLAMRQEWGLRNWHAYAIKDVRIEGGQRYIIMRNTATDFEFKGNGYDGDVDMDGDGKPDGKDGYFRIRIDDFQRLFATTTTLRLR